MSSVASDKLVPFGQIFVLDNILVTLIVKEWATFFLCLIDFSVDRCKYSESPVLLLWIGSRTKSF